MTASYADFSFMTPDELMDWLIDGNGLPAFVSELSKGAPDWNKIADRIAGLSHHRWEPTGSYVAGLHAMQLERTA